MAHTHRQTDTHTDGHGDSMTDPAQRAESVKTITAMDHLPWYFSISAKYTNKENKTIYDVFQMKIHSHFKYFISKFSRIYYTNQN